MKKQTNVTTLTKSSRLLLRSAIFFIKPVFPNTHVKVTKNVLETIKRYSIIIYFSKKRLIIRMCGVKN